MDIATIWLGMEEYHAFVVSFQHAICSLPYDVQSLHMVPRILFASIISYDVIDYVAFL